MNTTLGTWLFTWLFGTLVGTDGDGNRYYRTRLGGGRDRHGHERRWVVYRGENEASKVPPEWHAWLHHMAPAPLPAARAPWQKPHQPNLTGTGAAYRPRGHVLRASRRAPATGDYEPWRPS